MDKARIYNFDKNKGTPVVECLFNPTEYTFSKSNTWNPEKMMGKDLPLATFGGGGPMTLSLSLLFDTYMMDSQPDVRDYTEKVLNLMKVDPDLKDTKSDHSRPPRVVFAWGKYFGFKAVITSITQRFTLFLPDGKPVRATLDVTFQQVESEGTYPAQNPTSRAEVQKVRVVGPGETIDGIAFEEYGDSNRWKLIADHNQLDDPLRIRPGQKLAIPPLS
jgi:nucleoid-associated protein YgaU